MVKSQSLHLNSYGLQLEQLFLFPISAAENMGKSGMMI